MCSSCSTCCQSSVTRILPAKSKNYRHFYNPVILRSRKTWEYAILPIFVRVAIHCNPSCALILTPSCLFIFMRAKHVTCNPFEFEFEFEARVSLPFLRKNTMTMYVSCIPFNDIFPYQGVNRKFRTQNHRTKIGAFFRALLDMMKTTQIVVNRVLEKIRLQNR